MRIPRRTANSLMRLADGYATNTLREGGVDVEAIRRRSHRKKECEARGLRMCWDCERGFDRSLDVCPHCGTETIPF